MKKPLIALTLLIGLMTIATTFTVAAPPLKPAAKAAPVAQPAAAVLPVLHEHHPAIHHAIEALEAAKNELNHAKHDFGGHRVEAIEAIDRALHQLREAERFDR